MHRSPQACALALARAHAHTRARTHAILILATEVMRLRVQDIRKANVITLSFLPSRCKHQHMLSYTYDKLKFERHYRGRRQKTQTCYPQGKVPTPPALQSFISTLDFESTPPSAPKHLLTSSSSFRLQDRASGAKAHHHCHALVSNSPRPEKPHSCSSQVRHARASVHHGRRDRKANGSVLAESSTGRWERVAGRAQGL